MASLNSDDCLLVGRDGVDYKVHYQDFIESLEGDLNIDASGGPSGPVSWNDLTDKPSEFPPESHSHSYNDLSDLPTIPDAYSKSESDAKFMPLDLNTLDPLN